MTSFDGLESLRRREEQLGAIVDAIRCSPENHSLTIDALIANSPEYRAAYAKWDSAFSELIGTRPAGLEETVKCYT